MKEVRSDEEVKASPGDLPPSRPRRPKESWYHFVVPLLGIWFVVLIPLFLLQQMELSSGVRIALTFAPVPFLVVAGWYAIFRIDRFMDEFEIAHMRQMESIACRFLIFWILVGELLRAGGVEWDMFDGFQGLIWSWMLGAFLANRRIYGRFIP